MTRDSENEADGGEVTRREFLGVTGAALVAATATVAVEAQTGSAAGAPTQPQTPIQLTVNGEVQRITVQDHWTLAELLRDHLRLTGTKLGCERGECGACTVLIDGKPVYACSYLAAWSDGRNVVTVEGLARGGKLDPLQEAFITHDAPQCGFCTSGQLMTAKAFLAGHPSPSAPEVRAALAGNICRCSNYNRIVDAVMAAASAGQSKTSAGGAR
jgi:aerobic-type carbon monoxide dehydrogenase small subunit (CoxS/CutS family)